MQDSRITLTRDELKGIVEEALKAARVDAPAVKIDLLDLATQLRDYQTNQALRKFFTWEYRFLELLQERARRGARDTYDFIDREMREALFHADQFEVINARASQIYKPGQAILDLGVYKGGSTRALARIFHKAVVHGFDSFEGLPGDWSHAPRGAFGDVKGVLPNMPDNVRLYKGWFDDTLPKWAQTHAGETICLLRVDCDIYSSTKTIFDTLGHMLKPGTWICFDELIGYYGWQDHEHKAFMEFIQRTGYSYEYIAYGLTYTLACLK